MYRRRASLLHLLIESCAGERGHDGELAPVYPGLVDELDGSLEYVPVVAVGTQDEPAYDADPVFMEFLYGVLCNSLSLAAY